MSQETYFQLFKAPAINKPSHMMTDVPFWSRQFAMMAQVTNGHPQQLWKVVESQEKYIAKLKQSGLKGKDEETFYKEISSMNQTIRGHLKDLTRCMGKHAGIEHRLKRFKDDSRDCTEEIDVKYKKAREDLDKQTQIVETQRKKYQEMSFKVEKAELKSKLAESPGALDDAKLRLEVFTEKKESRSTKYEHAVAKWELLFDQVKKLSYDYQDMYQSREEARVKVVLSCLQNLADNTIAGKFGRRGGPLFIPIIEPRFVKERIIETEPIKIQVFQEYVGMFGKGRMLEKARSWFVDSDNANNSSQLTQTGTDDLCEFTVNQKLAKLTTVFMVKQNYDRKNINELSLKPGDQIKQILPMNEDGFAYGKCSRGLFKKAQTGFFPVSHTCLIRGFHDARRY